MQQLGKRFVSWNKQQRADYLVTDANVIGSSEGLIMHPVLSVSLVAFRPNMAQLCATFASFGRAVAMCGEAGTPIKVEFQVVNNGPEEDSSSISELLGQNFNGNSVVDTRLISGQGNIGFGRGHNIALAGEPGRYHLILNPDVELADNSLHLALSFMVAHPDCGLLTPAAFWKDGSRQYLCKRYPSVFDLLLRGFAPAKLRGIFKKRLDRYEMGDVVGESVVWDPQIVSGCFMLFRGDVLQRLGGFDPGYFLYFEDFDLSLRAASMSRLAYVPWVRIVHHGGHASRKGFQHVLMFARSAVRFFRTHGWRFV